MNGLRVWMGRGTVPSLVSLVGLCLALSACSVMQPVAPAPAQIFQDQLFGPGTERIDAAAVFAVSPAMQQFIDTELATTHRLNDRREGLIDALYSKHRLKLEYDSAMTRNAAQAFDDRRGNCLSLVVMTAAFAKALDLPVYFRSVYVDESWSRSKDFLFLSGHVNLTLGQDWQTRRDTQFMADGLTVDFVPAEMLRGQRTMSIDESTVVAMYMNNRAAENLDQGNLDNAYAWIREGLRQDPKFMAAWNTLGVIYRRHGNIAASEQAFRYVLVQEPANAQAMSNLVLVLKDQGRMQEADKIQVALRSLQPYPPFHYFDLGLQAMKDGDYRAARDLFNKEVARAAYYHEFHFWLALADYGLGDLREARKEMALAEENSTTVHDHDIYAAKLDWLNAQKKVMR